MEIAKLLSIANEARYPTPYAVSPLLPLLLLSLSRQKYAPDTARSIKAEYDYVIVGGGSAGSVMASRLSELPCVNILVLEAGKLPPRLTEIPGIARTFWMTDIDWKYLTIPQKYTGRLLINRQVIWPSGKAIGGSSIFNGMLNVRGNRKNYDEWAANGAHGWSYKDVLPYFKRLEDNRNPEYVKNGYHGIGGPVTVHKPFYEPHFKKYLIKAGLQMKSKVVDSNGPMQTGFHEFQATNRNGQRCSAAKAYLIPADQRQNLNILPNAMVRRIMIESTRAVGVKFDFQNKTYIVKARNEVILSAGTVNTAQLLMLSGIGPKRHLEAFQIPVIADLPVGYNLQDHPTSAMLFYMASETQDALMKLADPRNVLQYINNRTGILASAEGISLMAFLNNEFSNGSRHVMRNKKDFPDFHLYFAEAPTLLLRQQTGVYQEALNQYIGPYENKPLLACLVEVLQPESIGSVRLNSNDPYDPPLIDPNYFSNPKDVDVVVQGLKACKRICTSLPLRNIGLHPLTTLIPGCEDLVDRDDDYFRCVARAFVFTLSHQVGTAKMGDPKDPTTVVDTQLRVKGITSLRVVDASIMPRIPSGNTNIPVMMLAEKASEIIKRGLNYCEQTCKNVSSNNSRYFSRKRTKHLNSKIIRSTHDDEESKETYDADDSKDFNKRHEILFNVGAFTENSGQFNPTYIDEQLSQLFTSIEERMQEINSNKRNFATFKTGKYPGNMNGDQSTTSFFEKAAVISQENNNSSNP